MNPAIERLLKYVRPGCIFVDIGAHQGEWSIAFNKAGAGVYAIEPDSDNLYALARNRRENGCENGFTMLSNAISDSDGSRIMYRSEVSTLHSLRPDWLWKYHSTFRNESPRIVTCLSWSSFCSLCKIEKVDILKIDAEGHDHVVLGSVFNGGPVPPVICIEISPDNEEEVLKLMSDHSFVPAASFSIDGEQGFYDGIFELGP
jgi:FkbM family methyltransferase